MSVYIASFKLRGKWAECPEECVKLNVTSCQSKKSQARIDLSPMSSSTSYKGFYCFENFWQSGKRFSHLNHEDKEEHEKYVNKWKNLEKGKRKILVGKYKPFDALFETEFDKPLEYVESRKKVYIPIYYKLVKKTETIKKYKKMLKKGKSICIYDVDGPKDDNGNPLCVKFDDETWEKYLNDTKYPFGHGYTVAAILYNKKLIKNVNNKHE